jgi:hypothetical protein
VRFGERQPVRDSGFGPIGGGGALRSEYRVDMIYLPKGVAVRDNGQPRTRGSSEKAIVENIHSPKKRPSRSGPPAELQIWEF